jgi:hypothetical protein
MMFQAAYATGAMRNNQLKLITMNKPKFEIDDAVKVDGRPGVVFYVEKRSEAPRSVWVYTLRNINGETINAIESALTKATLKDDDVLIGRTVCFGQALEALKMGKKVFREAWTGQILWAWLGSITSNRFFVKLADLTISDYTMSYKDILACDWVIMIDEEKKESPDRIPVPENIKFARLHDKSLIVSPNGKAVLCEYNRIPAVSEQSCNGFIGHENRKAYLVPCKRSDLKPGDIGFRAIAGLPNDLQDFTIHHQYCVILNEDESAYWYNMMDMKVDGICGGLIWYKVIFE